MTHCGHLTEINFLKSQKIVVFIELLELGIILTLCI